MSDTLVLRTRPTTVEARRLTRENRDEVLRWIEETVTAWPVTAWPYGTQGVTWMDPDRVLRDAFVGEWVVKTAFGEVVKVSDSVIFSRYETVVPAVPE